MTDKTLVERLELAASDAIHDDAAYAIRAAILEMASLDAENFRLAAGSCDVEGGKIGDEHGHFRCSLQSRIKALEADKAKMCEALKQIARYDVGLQALIEDGVDTPENRAKYYEGRVEYRRSIARKALQETER